MRVGEFNLDIDTDFDRFVKDDLDNLVATLESRKWSAKIRRSSGGRVHVKVNMAGGVFCGEPTQGHVLNNLMHRAYFGDDPQRIIHDLVRFYDTGDPAAVDRVFDRKMKKGVIRGCGPWIDV